MATRKKTTKKKTSAKSSRSVEDKPRSKSQLFSEIADSTGLTRKDVSNVFIEMEKLLKKDLSSRGPGIFTVPGLMKVKRIQKPARPARRNVPNPFRPGETMNVAAKPARRVVKVTALKKLKEMV